MQNSKIEVQTNVPRSTTVDCTLSSQTIAKPIVSRSFIILYESNPERISGSIEKFQGEVMSIEKFNTNKEENFQMLKDWSLRNGKKVYILEVVEPLVKIIPEVTVFHNCG